MQRIELAVLHAPPELQKKKPREEEEETEYERDQTDKVGVKVEGFFYMKTHC